jgi:hypothetical protein
MARLSLLLTLPLLLACAAAVFLGCEDDDEICSPACTGTITGRITAPGVPVEAEVVAYRMQDESGLPPWDMSWRGEIDSTGSFLFPAATGRYILQVSVRTPAYGGTSGWLAHGTLSRSEADTLTVGAGDEPVRADLVLGAARIEIATPSILEGERFRALVRAREEEGGISVTAIGEAVDGEAVFYFPTVPGGRYRMEIDTNRSRFWLPGTYHEDAAEELIVQAGLESVHQADFPGIATIHGSITGSWQQLNLGGPTVLVYDSDSTWVTVGGTDNEGHYSIWTLAPIHARLMIEISGCRRWQGGNGYETATEYVLESGEQAEVNVIESGIAGQLGEGTRAYLDNPISLCDESGSVIARAGVSGTETLFRFANLVPGTYFVRIPRGSTWIGHWYNLADSLEQATPIEITREGQVVWIYPTLMSGAKISGRLLDAGGGPIPTAAVRIALDDGPHPQDFIDRRTHTGEGGEFDVTALADGAYKLCAIDNIRGTVWYPGTAAWDSAGVITISNHQDVTGIVIQYRP